MGGVRAVFGFSDTWQLVINTTTTIITFLMVFVIQNTQNRRPDPRRGGAETAGESQGGEILSEAMSAERPVSAPPMSPSETLLWPSASTSK